MASCPRPGTAVQLRKNLWVDTRSDWGVVIGKPRRTKLAGRARFNYTGVTVKWTLPTGQNEFEFINCNMLRRVRGARRERNY